MPFFRVHLFARGPDPHTLAVSMTGVQMGDRVVHVGCANGGRLGAIASKVGLSGTFVAIVPDEHAAVRARKGAANAGALVEIEIAPPTKLRSADAAFDLAIVDDTEGLVTSLDERGRASAMREALRVLRPGGRVVVLGAGERTGLRALLSRGPAVLSFDPTSALQTEGFKSVRKLAERDALVFTEGIKRKA